MLDRQQAQQAKVVLVDLTSQLAILKATMADVEARIIDMTNTLAPVSSIPHEILATIFKEVCRSDGYLHDGVHVPPPRSKLPSIILASHVNRRFRHVAIDTPSLWACVHIHLSNTMDIHLLDAYLERSKSNFLNVCIIGGTSQLDNVHKVVGRLLPHSGRWKTLSVESGSPACIGGIILALQHLCVPHLEFIRMAMHAPGRFDSIAPDNVQVRIFRGGASALTSVEFMNVNPHHCFPPLAALEALNYQIPFCQAAALIYDQFRDIAMAAPSLTDLRLSTKAFITDIGTELEPIDLPSLRTLVLAINLSPFSPQDSTCFLNLLKNFRIPGLQTLKLNTACPEQVTCFMHFLQAEAYVRYPLLQSLALVNCSDCFTLDLIHAIPNIRTLSLIRSAEDVVLKLLVDGDIIKSPLWPGLEALELEVVNLNLLREFISSREGRIDSLTLREVVGSPAIPSDFDDWLKAHVRNVDISAC